MGEMLLNGRLYGASGIRELTQAQYDALPDSKYSDGILYCIKDTGIVEGDKYAPVIYSLEEREVGVWTDGKPLYEKTIIATNTTKNAEVNIDVSNLNIATCINIFGTYSRISSVATPAIVITNMFNDAQAPGDSYYSFLKYTDTNKAISYKIQFGNSYDSTDKQIITLQYTKTTDNPGSGTWGTDGVPMVHYDGNEKIIGTWFGETLYEKVIHYGALPSQAQGYISYYNLNIANLDKVTSIHGYGVRTVNNVTTYFTLPFAPTTNVNMGIAFYVDNGVLTCATGTDRSNIDAYLTIQYTKTS